MKQIDWVDVHALKPNSKNRNHHPAEQIDRLAKIIEYQGFRQPIVVDKDMVVWAGHGRLEAAKRLKLKTVPIMVQEFESPEQAYAFLTSDNAIASWAELDLSGINTDIGDLGPDFDIDLLGIRNFEIEVADKEPQCDEDEVPEHVEPKTKPGDLYILGNHRLLCGDSTDILAVEKLMNGEKADMVFTDPPYNADYSSRVDKTRRKPWGGILNDNMTEEAFEAFLVDLNSSLWASLKDGASVYECIDWKRYPQMARVFADAFTHKAMIVWNKNYFGLGTYYRTKHELILFGCKGDALKVWNGSHDEMDVWDMDREKNSNYEHPTQKPVSIPERAIKNSSKKGNIVLDLFGGSGSTLIACEKTNRKCFMMELDSHYADVIVNRYAKFSGNRNVILNGEPYEVPIDG